MIHFIFILLIHIFFNNISICSNSEIILTEINKHEEHRKKLEDLLLFSMYPRSTSHFPIRRDKYDNHVSRGRYELLSDLNKTVSLSQFKEMLQCSINEPAFDEYYGTLSLLILFPPTKESIELLCAWGESQCENWLTCKERMLKFKNNEYNNDSLHILHDFKQFRMLRITNNKLYFDWPWGSHRARYPHFDIWNSLIFSKVLESVNDIGDSVFFIGGEFPSFPFKFPFIQINQAGSYSKAGGTNTIVWPWEVEYKIAYDYHQRIKSDYNHNYSDENFRKLTGTLPWHEKINKAAFYASHCPIRIILFEQCARHPDLFDFHHNLNGGLECWDPSCTRTGIILSSNL